MGVVYEAEDGVGTSNLRTKSSSQDTNGTLKQAPRTPD
jgi:hypothetical protein